MVVKTAENGDVAAMFDVGLFYYSDQGQPGNKPNYEEDLKGFKKAVEGGNEEAKARVVEIQKLLQ